MEPTTTTIGESDPWQPNTRRPRHVRLPEPRPDIGGLDGLTVFLPDEACSGVVAEATFRERLPAPSGLASELKPEAGRRVCGDTAEEFEITTSEHNGIVVVDVTGDVDVAASPWLRQQLLQLLGDQPAALILGLEQVAFMDASGLGTLAVVDRCARLADAKFKIAGPGRLVRKILAITGMDKTLAIFPSLADALTGNPPGRPMTLETESIHAEADTDSPRLVPAHLVARLGQTLPSESLNQATLPLPSV